MLPYKTQDRCRCCGSSDLIGYLNLGNQPLANSYIKTTDDPEMFIPLAVNLCKNCFHSQLSVVVDPVVMFSNYLYVSGTTATLSEHMKHLAEDTMEYAHPTSVLDIACNDGTLLLHFKNLGCEVFGVDPAANLRKITESKEIDVEVGFWSSSLAKKLNRKFSIITAQNVFAHVDDIFDFLTGCDICLEDNGFVIIEFPYGLELFSNNQFDTIYHEHLSYFLVNSFRALVGKTPFKICRIVQTSIHGGSIRFYLSRNVQECSEVEKMVETERKKGLLDVLRYRAFADRVESNRIEFRVVLEQLRKRGAKVIGYGASAKGNTMLNYFGAVLDFIVDDNPMKVGYLTPGQHIPIQPTSVLQLIEDNTYVVVLAWNFFAEIKERIKKMTNKQLGFILYVPAVVVEEKQP